MLVKFGCGIFSDSFSVIFESVAFLFVALLAILDADVADTVAGACSILIRLTLGMRGKSRKIAAPKMIRTPNKINKHVLSFRQQQDLLLDFDLLPSSMSSADRVTELALDI